MEAKPINVAPLESFNEECREGGTGAIRQRIRRGGEKLSPKAGLQPPKSLKPQSPKEDSNRRNFVALSRKESVAPQAPNESQLSQDGEWRHYCREFQ